MFTNFIYQLEIRKNLDILGLIAKFISSNSILNAKFRIFRGLLCTKKQQICSVSEQLYFILKLIDSEIVPQRLISFNKPKGSLYLFLWWIPLKNMIKSYDKNPDQKQRVYFVSLDWVERIELVMWALANNSNWWSWRDIWNPPLIFIYFFLHLKRLH